jgi:hypothetical protein
MRNSLLAWILVLVAGHSFAQGTRLWVLRAPDEMVEYDPLTFAAKQTVKVPAEVLQSPRNLTVNRLGQMLFSPPVALPVDASDLEPARKVWFWNGKSATSIDLGVKQETVATGSNQAITEVAPAAFLSADGTHLFWFANQARRLQREDVDLSTTTTWQAWQTDLTGAGREEIITTKIPECRCTTGTCEETCPLGTVWTPDGGVDQLFLMTEVAAGKDGPAFKASFVYKQDAGKWTASAQENPLPRVLDAGSSGDVIVFAIPDTGCCGWVNQSNDQTIVVKSGKAQTLFDEQATYKNPDYDVSFFTSNAKLSPDRAEVAMTITATATANQPIQISESGQANPEESKQIRKALADLPAVEVKSSADEDFAKRIAFLPHATLVGWISEKELLIVEDHVLVAYNVVTGARKKSTVRAEDVARVFLR